MPEHKKTGRRRLRQPVCGQTRCYSFDFPALIFSAAASPPSADLSPTVSGISPTAQLHPPRRGYHADAASEAAWPQRTPA